MEKKATNLRQPASIWRLASRITALFVASAIILTWIFAPPTIEQGMNQVAPHAPYNISKAAEKLHQQLVIGDLHADSLLWNRDITKRHNYGHVDLPRLREGNVAIQTFAAVTKSPRGQNYSRNDSEAIDNITLLAFAQAWPITTWTSLYQRAVYQAEKLEKIEQAHPDELNIIRYQQDLKETLKNRAGGSQQVAGLLAIEGAHALEGDLDKLQKLYDAGYRMIGLHHFFDNHLGGSLHGVSGSRLSLFGRRALAKMEEMELIVDLAHSSESVVDEVLKLATRPVVISHTGLLGTCDSPRNISDHLIKRVADKGGLIGIGFWDAICDITPEGIVKTLRYAIDLAGEDHIALGSDFDGSTRVSIDASELAVLTDLMIKQGFTETEIRKVMGGNLQAFLLKQLPKNQF
ncbi:dipeptidase [Endozoicomonas ascidiicola]|uniref:dipeptidase n=1 Tax=Endozoicomonas ascidiicola TaxID=1698521 RepID=UPI0008371A62|nr:membrane dipeptidase [Endozoicomonas ascidiicola]